MSIYLPQTMRILEEYKKGLLEQVVALSQNDKLDSQQKSQQKINKQTDYQKALKLLREVDKEHQLLKII